MSAPAGDEQAGTPSQKKSFWKWSTTKNVPGSIRALAFRTTSSASAAASSPSPTTANMSLGAKRSPDPPDWDTGDDEVTAAFIRSTSSPTLVRSATETAAAAAAGVDLSDPASASDLMPTTTPPRSQSAVDDVGHRHASSSVSLRAASNGSGVDDIGARPAHKRNGSQPISLPSSAMSSTPASPPMGPKPTTVAMVMGDGIGTMSDLQLPDMTGLTTLSPTRTIPSAVTPEGKKLKFRELLNAPVIDLDDLRKQSWNGIPDEFRPFAWKLLMGYLPLSKERRQQTLERKRHEYSDCIEQYFGNDGADVDQRIFHQIHIDVLRTNPEVSLFQNEAIQRSLERILYVWAIRHPASGYVQGINDLVTPFFIVFLSSHIGDGSDAETVDGSQFSQETLTTVEADSFWCLSKLLDGIQDNYTQSQPGIQRRVFKLKELVQRIDAPLHNHLQSTGVEFLQFSFRWMNCLLMREISLKNTIRMWDTYMAEGVDGYAEFHLYVCAAFLLTWTKNLQKMDSPEEMMMFLQSLPSAKWATKDIEILLSQAYTYKMYFKDAPSHLNPNH